MATNGPPDAGAFAESLAKLEAQIEAADASGDGVPPEARLMAAKLRDLVDALGALTANPPTIDPSVVPTTPADDAT